MKNILNQISMLMIILVLNACGTKTEESTSKNPEGADSRITLQEAQVKNAGIVVGKGENRKISSLIKVNGKIEVPPQNIISVSVLLGGYLRSTHLLTGTKVKKGEVIAIFEDQQYIQIQQDYLTAVNKINYLEKELVRQKELNLTKASSDKVLQQTETEYRSQKIAVKALYEKLKLIGIDPEKLDENNLSRSINLYSPIDGFVSKVNVNIGKYVNPADVVFELINPSDIHLALKVYEKDVDKLFIGQKLMVYSNNEPDKKHRAEIILIGQDLLPENYVLVHCHFESYDKTLLPGMYMNADLEVLSNNAYSVPEAAVVNFEGSSYIFTEEMKNTFQMTEVKTGISEGGFTELLNADDLKKKSIVTEGAYNLLMSLKNRSE